MKHKYGKASKKQVMDNETDLINQIYKLLPYKENNFKDLDYYFSTLLFRISGMSELFNKPSELITVLSLLESARNEEDFRLYRKAVLDSCSLIKELQERTGEE